MRQLNQINDYARRSIQNEPTRLVSSFVSHVPAKSSFSTASADSGAHRYVSPIAIDVAAWTNLRFRAIGVRAVPGRPG
jgi:hypothetical protein